MSDAMQTLDRSESQVLDFPAQNGGAGLPVPMAQRVQTRYTTAMSVPQPRVLQVVDKNALAEAALLGEDAYYGWGNGKNRVEGPSVKLAMCLIRIYGNCAVDLDEVQDLPDAWIFTARFVDLETGFTLSRQFRQSKSWVVYGDFDAARKEDIRFQIGQSKATRNVILNALPSWLVKRAMDRAMGGVREGLEQAVAKHGMEKVVEKAMRSLAEAGVDEARVLAAMGRQARGALTIEDLVIMQGGLAAVRSGADTIDGAFPVKANGGAEAVGTRAQQVVNNLKKSSDTPAPAGDVADPLAGTTPTTASPAEEERRQRINAQAAEASKGKKGTKGEQGTLGGGA